MVDRDTASRATRSLKSHGLRPWQHSSMAEDDIASRMVEALQDAPSMQLYQMRALMMCCWTTPSASWPHA